LSYFFTSVSNVNGTRINEYELVESSDLLWVTTYVVRITKAFVDNWPNEFIWK